MQPQDPFLALIFSEDPTVLSITGWGWPLKFVIQVPSISHASFCYWRLAFNCFFAAALLALFGLILEWMWRKKDAALPIELEVHKARLHSTTYIVVLATTVFLLWANTVCVSYLPMHSPSKTDNWMGIEIGVKMGWPAQIASYGNGYMAPADKYAIEFSTACRTFLDSMAPSLQGILINLAVGLVIVVGIGVLWETCMRRRSANQP